ncbi:uncharacterized protein LOC131966552 [Centropristis striata]|uniref:uncharacterized protein LOC131966552 n=1 Tax=Centropristis striata TaxID=184440 RepID=UPI0027E0D293|nr:uncharacterized protein LOC131966552 [Centropristis striata]
MRSLLYFVAVLVVMSFAVSDSESESQTSGEECDFIPVTQAQPGESHSGLEAEASLPRRSSRSNRKRLAGWPVHRILETLYARNISVPSGLNHEELFNYLQSQEATASAQEFNGSDCNTGTAPTKGKAAAKKRGASQTAPVKSAINVPPKRTKRSAPSTAEASIMSSLDEMKSALNVMNARIHSLEENANSAFTVNIPGPSTSSDVPRAAALPADVTPHRTLGTAVPATPMGSRFLPPAAAIPDSLRNQILSGQDINLVKILLCGSESAEKRFVDCGDFSVVLKDSDPRLSKTLNLAEFNVAFGVFRDTICEVYPQRREELDTYLAIISDLALSYGGSLFYEYHKSFSSKAAMYIQKFNQKLDWSVVDLALISRNFTGHKTIACSICGSFSHTSSLCPRTARQELSTSKTQLQPKNPAPFPVGYLAKSQVPFALNQKSPICNNFNNNVCSFPNCKFMHVCSWCGDSHPRSVCPRRLRPAKSGK